jgi:hypothetical protein
MSLGGVMEARMAVIVDRVVDRASIIDAIPSMRECVPRGGGVEVVIDRFCQSRERHKRSQGYKQATVSHRCCRSWH